MCCISVCVYVNIVTHECEVKSKLVRLTCEFMSKLWLVCGFVNNVHSMWIFVNTVKLVFEFIYIL